MATDVRLRQGYDALASGDWALAERLFDEAVAERATADGLDGLGRARWWRRDVRSAMELRTRAHRAYQAEGRRHEAAMVAVWLAREHRTLFRNDAAGAGWLARATTLAGTDDARVSGWISLARAEADADPARAIPSCRAAVDLARRHRDPDLEIVALARLGVLRVATGDVEGGIADLDEAMAGAGSGEAADLQSVGTAYCAVMEAGELLGDSDRFAKWTTAMAATGSGQGFGPLETGGSSVSHGTLSSFCGTCCGGMYLVTGRLDDAERELRTAITDLDAGGMSSRCVHPVTQLAELRVHQGRFEEARSMLEPYEDLPESIRPLAVLDLSLGSPETAAARLTGQVERLGGPNVAVLPLLALLVDALVALGDLDAAGDTAAELTALAASTRSRRHRGEALFAMGKVAAARSSPDAPELLRTAARALAEPVPTLQECRARMALARTLAESDRPRAVTEARAALAAFERMGAGPDADGAAAFLRDLGVRGRTGPKLHERLTLREAEVLRLVSQGLSNHEIAARLFISDKTAGHHVSNILTKLDLRSRTEAAAYAAVHLPPEPAPR